MTLSDFAVVHARNDGSDDPLVHCYVGRQLVLTYIAREALEDYFRVPGDTRLRLAQWNLVVDRNLAAFKRIIEAKFERDDWQIHDAYGQSYPKLAVTLEDMHRSGEEFTIEVLRLDAGFRPRPV
jgi:hypothetical protein